MVIFWALVSCNNENQNSNQLESIDLSQPEESEIVDTLEIEQTESEELELFPENRDFDDLVQRYEDPDRNVWQNPNLVLNKLGDLSNKVVADLGAGTGYFSFRIAQNAQKVIAIDVDERFLEYIEDRKTEFPEGMADNIVTRLTQEDQPNLAPNEVDVVLVVNTYHFINNREAYFQQVNEGLKPNGILVIVDFKNGRMPVGPPEDIKVTPETVFQELRAAGFQEFQIDEKSLQYQYIIIAS